MISSIKAMEALLMKHFFNSKIEDETMYPKTKINFFFFFRICKIYKISAAKNPISKYPRIKTSQTNHKGRAKISYMARGVLIRMSSSYIIWPGGGGGGGSERYPKCFYHTHMTLKCGTCKSMIYNDTWGHNI